MDWNESLHIRGASDLLLWTKKIQRRNGKTIFIKKRPMNIYGDPRICFNYRIRIDNLHNTKKKPFIKIGML